MKKEKSLFGNLSKTSGGSVTIDDLQCIHCGECIDLCLEKALSFGEGDVPVVDDSKCNSCGTCNAICPTNAIEMKY